MTKPPAMPSNAKSNLTPKLRFPEFRKTGEWKETKLGQLGKLVSGLTYSPQDTRSSGLLVLRSSNIQDGKIALDDCVYVTPNIKGANLSSPSDILICVRNGSNALIGKNAMIPEGMPPCTHGAFMTVFRAKNPEFVYQLFQTQAYKDQVAADLGARINSINNGQLINYEFLLPPTKYEQQKIAECLSTLDELMGAESQKLDALRAYKKGLMQQLFPRAGETRPRLRFPEFQNAPEWRLCTVADFAKVTTGGRDTQNKVENGKYPFFVRSQTVERIDSYSHDGEAVLTSGDGVGVGKNYHYIKGKFDFHQRVYCIYDFAEDASGLFFYLYFSEHFQERVMRMTAKNSVDSVRMAMITEMPVMLPSVSEQQRIADCLSSLDDLIAAQSAKLTALKTHKQGLMQQLFPSPTEAAA